MSILKHIFYLFGGFLIPTMRLQLVVYNFAAGNLKLHGSWVQEQKEK